MTAGVHDIGKAMWAGCGARGADARILAGAPRGDAPLSADPSRPWLIKYGKHFRASLDRMISAHSLVPDAPVLDVRDFAWTGELRGQWRAIRDEAFAALERQPAPSLATISPDHRAIAPADKWRSLFLWGYGYPIEPNRSRCPRTAELVERIPGLTSAFFSILAPGTHIPAHRGVTKGLITCQLGLVLPREGDARMRVGDRVLRWSEGETLVFDDTVDHELWNDGESARMVLHIQFRRPLARPGKWIADGLIGTLRRSAFVRDARANIARWNAACEDSGAA